MRLHHVALSVVPDEPRISLQDVAAPPPLSPLPLRTLEVPSNSDGEYNQVFASSSGSS
jgi:hypothetical protein